MKMLDADVTGIHQVNSVDFVLSAFRCYNSGDVLAILKQANSDLRLKREITPSPGGGWLDVKQDVIQDDRPAQIVFTSGTEGVPKAILLSHRALADVVVRLNSIMKVDESIREYVGIPVTYSFGFGRCRAVAAIGGRCYIPEHGFNPIELARMLAADEINAISAVPTLWRTLLVQPEIIGTHGSKVKWIEIGSQYMSREEKEQMKQLFPNAVIVQHYGLTEASRTTFLNISETEGGLLESVGQATGNAEVKLSSDGLIMIRGPHVAMGRVMDGEIKSLVDADGWYTTGDFGRLENGNLYYVGRADDLINCAGIKVSPEHLQEQINRRLNIKNGIAVCRIADELRGDGFFVAIESGSGIDAKAVQAAAFVELMALGINAQSSVKIQEVNQIPRTDTGKVRRKELSNLYSSDKAENRNSTALDKHNSVRELYARIFPSVEVEPGDTFRTLGGDSLNYVQMLMLLENRFGFTPPAWDTMPVERLDEVQPKSKSSYFSWLDTSIFLRVIAIVGVVATHSGGTVLGGGTWLLFMLIGYNMARFKAADFTAGKVWQWLKTYSIIILIPYYLVAALYLVRRRSFEPDILFLYANLVDFKITVVFPFWFVQVLLQCLILIGIMFSIPAFRRYAAASPRVFSFSVLVCLIAIRAIYPFVWDTTHLNNLVPQRFIAILWLGWCFNYVSTFRQRVLLSALAIGFTFLDQGIVSVKIWLIFGSLFLAFVPRVPIPFFLKRVFNDIGAATFYIFVLNGLIISFLTHSSAIDSKAVVFCISMMGSMAVWWVMERLRLIAKAHAVLKAITSSRT